MDYPGWVALANCFAAVRIEQYLWYVGPFQPVRAWWVTYRQECWARKLQWYDEEGIPDAQQHFYEMDADENPGCRACNRRYYRAEARVKKLEKRRESLKNKMAAIVP